VIYSLAEDYQRRLENFFEEVTVQKVLLLLCRMSAIQPACGVCSTVVFRNTGGGNFSSTLALETEPGRTEPLVTMSVCCINSVRGFSV